MSSGLKARLHAVLFIVGLAAWSSGALAATAPTEETCRKAIEQALDVLRNVPANDNGRNEVRRKELLADMERLAAASRRQGMTECQTWAQMIGKAFRQ
jgi:hypothetical protein